MIFGKENRNLQRLSSFANGCLRWLYPASSKKQVLLFFLLLHNPHNVYEIISIFYTPLFNSGSRIKVLKKHLPSPPAPKSYDYGYPQSGYLPVLGSMYF
jgi:hypothetical protein